MDHSSGEFEQTFKVLVIGDSDVGKSSLLLKYVDNVFSDESKLSIGVDHRNKHLTLEEKKIKLIIWDTAGQERFRTLTPSLYRNVHGILLVFDMFNADSFKNLNSWIDYVDLFAHSNPPFVLIGNKIDLADSKPRAVSTETAQNYAVSKKFPYLETSAKAGVNVEQAFEALTKIMVEKPRSASSNTLRHNESQKLKSLSFKKDKQNNSNCCN